MTDTATGTVDAELIFPPRPGGRVDTARKQPPAGPAQPPAPPRRKVPPITVKIRQPSLFAAKTITVGPGGSAQAMGADPARKRGVLSLLTASATVIVARDRANADTGTGYMLFTANPPLELGHTREVWLSNPGTAAVQVSVFTESYESE